MQGLRRSIRFGGAFGCALLAALFIAAPSPGGFGAIGVGDDFFDPSSPPPTGLSAAIFSWEWNDDIADEHNVRQDNKLFRSGPLTDSPAASFGPIELPAGTYHYYCEAHGDKRGGMDGLIKISPSAKDSELGDSTTVTWALDTDIRIGDRWQVQYRKGESGKWKTWKKSTGKLSGEFGKNDKPVNYNPEKTYQVRVKTKLAAKPDRQSKFSPPASFGFMP
jgi:hypothetical protein